MKRGAKGYGFAMRGVKGMIIERMYSVSITDTCMHTAIAISSFSIEYIYMYHHPQDVFYT